MPTLQGNIFLRNHLRVLSVCICLFLLFGCRINPDEANLLSGRITRVLSGQSIEVIFADTSEIAKVRITGIDAPDLRQFPWGKTAKERLTELVQGRTIKIETEDLERDRFNRIKAHVWQDKTLVSEQLVKDGCVLANTEYPHSYSKLLIDAQEYARLMGYGIWDPQQPLRHTPQQFRSQIKSQKLK